MDTLSMALVSTAVTVPASVSQERSIPARAAKPDATVLLYPSRAPSYPAGLGPVHASSTRDLAMRRFINSAESSAIS